MKRKKTLIVCSLLLLVFVLITGSLLLPKMLHASASIGHCNKNMILLQEAKRNWAKDNDMPKTAVPTWDDLKEELKSYAHYRGWTNGRPVCPQGGNYTLSPVGKWPTCSVGGRGHNWGNEK